MMNGERMGGNSEAYYLDGRERHVIFCLWIELVEALGEIKTADCPPLSLMKELS